jgi:ribosomal protein S18 acetylase RimI-like enzyme
MPRTDREGLDSLAALWRELHAHHLALASYAGLLNDPDLSWQRRRAWYLRALDEGGFYVTATAEDDRLVGYTMVAIELQPDDTFASDRGIAEVITLIVSRHARGHGLGQALLRSAEHRAAAQGADTMKIGVMAGNDSARAFYERHQYAVAEHVLYRPLNID